MSSIQKKDFGNNSQLQFKTDSTKVGDISFTESGFAIKGAVGTREIKVVPFTGDLVLDTTSYNSFFCTLTGDVTSLTLKDPLVGSYLLFLEQDGTGNHTFTFGSNPAWRFMDGTPPTLTVDAGAIDSYGLFYDGTNVYVYPSQNFLPSGT